MQRDMKRNTQWKTGILLQREPERSEVLGLRPSPRASERPCKRVRGMIITVVTITTLINITISTIITIIGETVQERSSGGDIREDMIFSP